MNHAALKVLLQRRLNDLVADQYDSSILDSFLAVGLSQFQAMVQDINPDGFGPLMFSFATVSGQDSYSRNSAFQIFRLEVQDPVSGEWKKIAPQQFQVLLDDDSDFSFDQLRYSEVGTSLFLRPTPDSVFNVRYWFLADIGSQVGWDAYDDLIPTALHTLPVDLALIEALGENADGAEKVEKRIAFKSALLTTLYGRSSEGVSRPNFRPFSSTRG